jgi:hypothetical protein
LLKSPAQQGRRGAPPLSSSSKSSKKQKRDEGVASTRSASFSTKLTHLINVVSRCSHGALSPCCESQDAPTERGGYRANVYEMAYKHIVRYAESHNLSLDSAEQI